MKWVSLINPQAIKLAEESSFSNLSLKLIESACIRALLQIMCGTTGNEHASLFQCKHYFVCITLSLVLKVQVINWMLLNTYFSYFCQDEMSPSKNVFQLLCGFYDILLLCFFLPPIPRSRSSSCFLLFESLLSKKKINWNQLFLYFFYVVSVLLPLNLFQFTCITFITCGTLCYFSPFP